MSKTNNQKGAGFLGTFSSLFKKPDCEKTLNDWNDVEILMKAIDDRKPEEIQEVLNNTLDVAQMDPLFKTIEEYKNVNIYLQTVKKQIGYDSQVNCNIINNINQNISTYKDKLQVILDTINNEVTKRAYLSQFIVQQAPIFDPSVPKNVTTQSGGKKVKNSKQHIQMKGYKKQYVVRENNKGKKYIRCDGKDVLLSDIKNKYKYV